MIFVTLKRYSTMATLLDLLKGRDLTSFEAAPLTGRSFRTCSCLLGRLVKQGLATRDRIQPEKAGRPTWRYSINRKGINTPCTPQLSDSAALPATSPRAGATVTIADSRQASPRPG